MRVAVDDRGWPKTVQDDSRTIVDVLETWRIDDEWWREPISRRYFDVALEGGGHVVLFEDLTSGNWYLQMP